MKKILLASRKLFIAFLSVCLFSMVIQSFAHADKTPAPIKIPDTITGIWTSIDKHTATIDKLIAFNQLSAIHAHAFAIRDLIKALPGLSHDLSSEQLAEMRRDSGYVDQLAARLDKTGDANDKDGTLMSFNKLQKILEQIRANYNSILNLTNK